MKENDTVYMALGFVALSTQGVARHGDMWMSCNALVSHRLSSAYWRLSMVSWLKQTFLCLLHNRKVVPVSLHDFVCETT
jgi:hypothetical protein